jgi:cytidine deaminase
MPEGPELFFGLVGAVGTDISAAAAQLTLELHRVDYKAKVIRLSRLLGDLPRFVHLQALAEAPEDERIDAHMKTGNVLRALADNGDAVARLGINEIRAVRETLTQDPNKPAPRTAYILQSLKHPQEAVLLRDVYGTAFHLISVYQPHHVRREQLVRQVQERREIMARDIPVEILNDYQQRADFLIEKDAKEVSNPFGQDLRDVFPMADLFVSLPDYKGQDIGLQMRRFIEILFGARFHTPDIDEYGMFHAKAAALRSSDISRQVGAIILTQDGCVMASGCNEVPLPREGGHFWPNHHEVDQDNRDFRLSRDTTAEFKHDIVSEIFKALRRAGWLTSDAMQDDDLRLTYRSLYEGEDPILRNTRVASILEFGRIVHAEMSALMDAGRRGCRTQGGQLFCTTFPCHICARHILAAGIARVVYIEPYPKSLAKQLYPQEIRVEGDENAENDAVSFEPFIGIAPRRYLDFFEALERKAKKPGKVMPADHLERNPRFASEFPTYLEFEAGYATTLEEAGLTEAP